MVRDYQIASVIPPVDKHGSGAEITRLERALDYLLTFGIVGLLVYAAYTGGAAKRRELTTLEGGILLLFLIAVTKLSISNCYESILALRKWTILPLAAFLTFTILQLLPLPPIAIRSVSPNAYRVYQTSIAGWPGYLKPVNTSPQVELAKDTQKDQVPHNWRSLAIAPSISQRGTLKFALLALLLWILIDYPRPQTELVGQDQVALSVLVGAIAVGFALSIVAIEKAESLGILRARATFANYDHFAGFESLILPIAIAMALSHSSFLPQRWSFGLRAFAGIAAFAILSSLMMSGSRAGWLGAGLGSLIAFLGSDSSNFADFRPWLKTVVAAGGAVTVVLLLFVFLGTQGSSRVDDRLNETFAENPLTPRLAAWNDTLRMVGDFPLTGVGLGAWAEIFPHYERPPWDNDWYWGETHNDFLELLAETGAIGFALLISFLLLLAGHLVRSLHRAPSSIRPFLVALCAIIAVAIPEEFFDFDLQLPANGLLFVLLIGIALRLSRKDIPVVQESPRPARWRKVMLGGGAAITVVVAFVAVVRVNREALRDPQTLQEAEAYILADPGSAQGHVSLIELSRKAMSLPQYVRELQTILWLDPNNPYFRDDYARYLLRSGNRGAGLAELKESVLRSPDVATHSFLGKPLSLAADEASAIESGLNTAIERGYSGAVPALAAFYRNSGRLHDAGLIYYKAALRQDDSFRKSAYLIDAGMAFAESGDMPGAQRLFRGAIASSPHELDGYRALMELLLQKRDLPSGLTILNEGIRGGVDTYLINMAFARIARSTGYYSAGELTAQQALKERPADLEAIQLLGDLFLEQAKYAKAAELFERATESAPSSALDYYLLAQADEGNYNYFAAEQALRHAVALEPENAFFRQRFKQFNDLLAQNRPR